MENPAPFNLEAAIHRWREQLKSLPSIHSQDAEELHAHLLDSLSRLQGAGLSDEEAWIIAQKRFGRSESLGSEFSKLQTMIDTNAPAIADTKSRSMVAIGVGFAVTVALSFVAEWWVVNREFMTEEGFGLAW